MYSGRYSEYVSTLLETSAQRVSNSSMPTETPNESTDLESTDLANQAEDTPKQLQWVDRYTGLLDSKFGIPGTNLRFGVDFILGLVPGAGDLMSLGLSGVLVATMAKHGASPLLVLKMLFNIALDATVGSIPILGNIFDLFYRANTRNLNMMRAHYEQGKHSGSIWPALITIAVVLSVIAAAMIWVLSWLYGWISNWFAG